MVRKKLHKLGVHEGFKTVFSPEPVSKDKMVVSENEPNKKTTVGTISYMPAIIGMVAASVVIRIFYPVDFLKFYFLFRMIKISIDEMNGVRNFYLHERYLIHFHEKGFGEWQTGLFNFEIPASENKEEKEIFF